MTKSSVYITGASGFIGQNLINKLSNCQINSFYISRSKLNYKNSILVKSYNEFTPKSNSILVHLAENNNISEVETIGLKFINYNMNILNSILKKKWKHVIYISSIAASGDCNQTSVYKKNKLACEKIILELQGTVLRMTNLYGPLMSKNNVFSDIIKQLNKEVIILKNANSIRDFLWIEDGIQAIIDTINKRPGGILNVASGKCLSIKDLAKNILSLSKKDNKEIKSIEKKKDILKVINIEDTKKILNWRPKTSLESGIKKLLSYNKL